MSRTPSPAGLKKQSQLAGQFPSRGRRCVQLEIFFFGLGYCARRLIQREPWIEASGTARTAESVALLRREGIEAYQFDGAGAEPGLEAALAKAETIVVSIPPRDGAGAALEQFGAAIAAASARRRIVYYSTIGVYGDHSAAGSTRQARRGPAPRADWRGWRMRPAGRPPPGHTAPRPTSCALPASMGRAATRSSTCAAATRGGSSSQAKSSTAPMSMTSLRFPASSSCAALRARSGTSPMKNRRRRKTLLCTRRLCSALSRRPRSRSRGTLSPMAREFYADNKRVSIARAKGLLGFSPPIRPIARGSRALPALARGWKDIADRSSAATKLLTTSRRDRERADNLLPGGPRTVYCFSEPAAGTG